MSAIPIFLPPILNLDGAWPDISKKLYGIFKNDFVDKYLILDGMKICYDIRKLVPKNEFEMGQFNILIKESIVKTVKEHKEEACWNVSTEKELESKLSKVKFKNSEKILNLWKKYNQEELFWHLIQREYGQRIVDYERAKRLPWVRAIVENHNDPEVEEWDYIEGNGKKRRYLWLKNHDFVVILEYKARILILITAFCVGRHKKKDLLKKYSKREML